MSDNVPTAGVHSLPSDVSTPSATADRRGRRRLIAAAIAAAPAILTLTAGPASAQGHPSQAPSAGPESLPPEPP